MAIFLSITVASIKTESIINPIIKEFITNFNASTLAVKALSPLEYVLCIYHPMRFKKNEVKVQTLLDFGGKINVMTLVYAAKLDLKVRAANVKVQKIDGCILEMFEIVLTSF